MAQQLNYDVNEALADTRLAINRNWSATGQFDYENVKAERFAFDADRCNPPRQGQLFPQAVPLFGV